MYSDNSDQSSKIDDTRSSRPELFCKKSVFRNFAKFTGKHLCPSLFFNKVAGLRPATLLKKRLWHRCFPVNFVKFLRTPFLQNTFVGCFCHIYFKEMRHSEIEYILVNSFYPKIPFLNPLKTSENKRFSDVFRGYRNGIY